MTKFSMTSALGRTRWCALVVLANLFLSLAWAQPPPSANTLVVAVSALPTELDPDFGETTEKGNVLRQVFDLPTWYDSNGVLHPWVVESWELLNENRTYRLSIRQGLQFASGTPVNAETVKFTFDRMTDPAMLAAGANNQFPIRVSLVSTEVVDEYTLDINTAEPTTLVPLRLYVVFLVDPAYYEGASIRDVALTPHGGGPYRVTEFVPAEYVVLERNENYWFEIPDVERLVLRAVPERSSRLAMLETGEVDIAMDLAPDDIPLLQRIPHAKAVSIPGARRIGLVYNQRDEYFADKRVRQALNYAVDWDEIRDTLLYGLGDRLVTYRGSDVCSSPDLLAYPYDPARALALLDEAGFPMDKKLTIDVAGNGGYRIAVLQAVAAQLGRIGLNVEVNVVEFSVYNQMITNRNFNEMIEVGLGGRGVPVQDAEVLKNGVLWHPGGWDDEQAVAFNELLAEMEATFDEDIVCDMTKELEALAHDGAPWLFLHRQLIVAGVNNRVDWQPRIDGQLFFRDSRWVSH
ncbi:MAG: ABC transporter substrate-binding protein [Trueperaceae bacterium]|nr:ABC transporter substrate-binding protein [Trueperaceae bacterium]